MPREMVPPPAPRVVTAFGPRAAERVLFETLERLRPRTPAELAAPVRVVVPSRSLRLHVAARLAAGGRAWAGVSVETLTGLAHGVLARTGAPVRPGQTLLGVLVRRMAAAEPRLAAGLAGLADPFAAVVASVRDLLDAGFGPGQAEAVLELLEAPGGIDLRDEALARARAVVRVASGVAEAADALGLDVASRALARAAEALDRGAPLPAREVIVHGFAEVTGVAGDLLDALVRRGNARVIVDLPPDAVGGGAGAFADRLLQRLGRLASVEPTSAGSPAVATALLEAADEEAEAREVVEQIRRLLDEGVEPERIGVVVREVSARLSLLARHLDRLAVPFSGIALSAPGGDLRVRLGGLLQVLSVGAEVTVDCWQEAASGVDASFEASAALRFLGAARLGDLARIDPPSGGVRLPLADEDPDGEGDDDRPVEPLRVAAELLAAQRDGARAALEVLTGWPEPARPSVHALQTAGLVECHGGWPEGAERALHEAVEACAAQLAPLGQVTRREWARALAETTRELGRIAVGGRGGGVQVLGAMEARARTFDHLFVLALQRDVFPRRAVEDPLLPDAVRTRLAVLLPEVPVKRRGHLEERYLFAQLAAASERVVLSWSAGGGRGPGPASPFVEELRATGATPAAAARGTLAGTPATAWERAVSCGLAGNRSDWSAYLASALGEGWRGPNDVSASGPAAAARGLAQALEELERPVGDPGPMLGVLGGGALSLRDPAAVTTLEAFARCPWQAFVARVLRVAPMADPLLALPSADRRLVGVVVHEVLARRAADCGAAREVRLGDAFPREPGALAPSDEGWLHRSLAEAAAETVRREGVPFPGFAPVLALLARPFVVAALDLDAGAAVVAAEAEGGLAVAGAALRFRADRVDAGPGGLVLTDYKTGRPGWARLKLPASRHRRLMEAIGRGELLQAAAYAGSESASAGRYLHLDPEADDQGVEIRVESSDREARAAMERAVGALTEAWARGLAMPRTSRVVARTPRGGGEPRLELTESPWCGSCQVRQACVRDDSGLRRRLEAWLDGPGEGPGELDAAARALWRLGAGPDDDRGDGE